MIELVYPRIDESQYLHYNGFAFGPFGPNLSFVGDRIDLPISTDTLVGAKGNYHENDVMHRKSSGTLVYHPAYNSIIPYPTAYLPDQAKIPWGVGSALVTLSYGLAVDGSTKMSRTSTVWTHLGFLGRSAEGMVYYKITANVTAPERITTVGRYVILPVAPSGTSQCKCTYSYTFYSLSPTMASEFDWSTRQSFETIEKAYQAGSNMGEIPTKTSYTIYATYGIIRYSQMLTPSIIAQTVDRVVKTLINRKDNLPVEQHFGDLAMKASEQVNATRINMLAFLRDLKDVKSLIPSLRNLTSLKGASRQFLAVKYGILPTISDLQHIVTAMKNVKPNYDVNGFTPYYASCHSSSTSEYHHSELEQHIKIAIANEDNAFESLLEGLERIGIFPSLEHVWDLIPYTFVIDWFMDVGDLLARVDTNLRLIRLNIRYATMSTKLTTFMVVPLSPDLPCSGTISSVLYHRWTTDRCPVPPLSLQTPLTAASHWLEAGALIIQRL